MASEVGSAYVTLIPSAKGFASKMQRELAGEVSRVGKAIGDDLGEEVGQEGGKTAAGLFGKTMKAGLGKVTALVGAAAIGATLGKGISDAFNADALRAKLTAQLGLSGKQSARAGKVAGELFGQNYGDSMEQVNEAIGSVIQNIDGMRGASDKTLERISTKALNTANIFDQDLGGTTRAVSQMIRTGLAKNADEAFDILTKGFQSGADKSDDFLDTLNEYGTQFRKLGLSGQTATGLISQGLKAGARDGDLVADALKEFSIRAVDGSDASAAAYKQLGLNAHKMTAQIAKGGPEASKGLETVLNRVRAIKDPVKQGQAAVGLFGTQAEDLGKALFKLHPETAAKGLGKVKGAADKANASFNDTPTAKLQAFTRQLQQGLTNAMAKYVIPAVNELTPLLSKLGPAFGKVGDAVKSVTGFFKEHKGIAVAVAGAVLALTAATAAHAVVLGVSSGALKAWFLGTKLVSAATRVWAAVQWVLNAAMSANPIGLIVLAIAALVVAVVLIVKKLGGWHAVMAKLGAAWDAFKAKMAAVWSAVKDAVVKGVDAVVGFVKKLPGKALDALRSMGSKLKDLFSRVWSGIKDVTVRLVTAYVQFYIKLPGRLLGALQAIGGKLKDLFTRAWSAAKTAVTNGIENVMDAVRALPGKIADLGGRFLDTGRALIGKFVDGLRGAGNLVSDIAGNIWDAVRGLLNSGIDKLNSALEFRISVLGKGVTIDPPDIPHLASGGRASSATLAVIGEGREPETVLPDSMLRGLLERSAGHGQMAGQRAELTITNWEQGTGYFRLVANDAVNADARYRRNLGAMHA